VGTNNTVNKCFHAVSMEIMYNSKEMNLVDIEKGLVGKCILMNRIKKKKHCIILLIFIRFESFMDKFLEFMSKKIFISNTVYDKKKILGYKYDSYYFIILLFR